MQGARRLVLLAEQLGGAAPAASPSASPQEEVRGSALGWD